MTPHLWTHARLVTCATGAADGYGLIDDGVLVCEGEQIVWAGPARELPPHWLTVAEVHDAQGALITPGWVDCHTHLVYGGQRAHEFELRLNGASYEEVARAGGGIVSTVQATRDASAEDLYQQAQRRLKALMAEGVTTVEIKSGYGLSLAHERKCLQVARRLGQQHAMHVCTTFLGAHALPSEYAGRADDYIQAVVDMMGPLKDAGLVDAVDVFCERIGFSLAQTERVFQAAQRLGLPVKLHAEQLSDSQGAALAAKYGALSCDHLEWLSEDGVRAMATAGTVAVLLPGAFYFLRETRVPPIARLREHRVPMAVATDCNPGSSPCTSMLLMLNMACTLMRLTPQEAILGATRHAAQALGLHDRGQLVAGQRADFVLWDVAHPAELCYAMGANPRQQTIWGGQPQKEITP